MAINERVITGTTAAAGNGGAADAEQGLILHLDANDVDSYDGDGSVWYDISTHEVTVPLSDNADDLEFHLNFSDSDSYSGTGTTFNDISGNSVSITTANVVASDFDKDNGGYFDVQQGSETWSISHSSDLHATTTNGFTYEFWLYFDTAGNDTFQWFVKGDASNHDAYFYMHEGNGWYFQFGGLSNFIHNADKLQNQWVHVMFTLSSNVNPTQKLYINGELKKTVSASGTITSTSSRDLDFGAVIGNANDLYGRLGCVRLYKTELSASEVGQNYRHGRDYIYTGLNSNSDLFLHYDPADTNSYSGTGTSMVDLEGNNNADLLGGIGSGWDEELGNSFPITGSGDGITTSSTVSINPATDGMTIEMWVKISTDSQNYLFSFDGTLTTRYGLSYRSNTDKITWFYRDTGDNSAAINSDTIVLNEWTHIVATTDGSSAQFYTNGVLTEETSSNAYSNNYNEDLHFGNYHDLAQNSNTHIGQIRFYKGGLTADEVLQNYIATKNDYPNGFNATLTNMSSSDWNSSGYFTFSANSDRMQTTFQPNITVPYSMSVWVNRTNYVTNGTVLDYIQNASPYNGIGLLNKSNGTCIVMVNGNESGVVIGANSSGDVYDHIVFVYNGGTSCRTYINGVGTDRTLNATPNQPNSSTNFVVGNSYNQYFNASRMKVSDVRFYDKQLTDSEVTSLHSEGSGVS